MPNGVKSVLGERGVGAVGLGPSSVPCLTFTDAHVVRHRVQRVVPKCSPPTHTGVRRKTSAETCTPQPVPAHLHPTVTRPCSSCARTGIGDGRRYARLNARPKSFDWFTWIGGVHLMHGSMADQGRTRREDSSSRLWRPASTRHPREVRPINWAQRGGLASGGKCLLTPRPHFTAHHARLVTRWFVLRTALLFVRSAVRLVYSELPGPVAVCSPNQAHCEPDDRVLGWRPHRTDTCVVGRRRAGGLAGTAREAGPSTRRWCSGPGCRLRAWRPRVSRLADRQSPFG
jgi:hypothetical protein